MSGGTPTAYYGQDRGLRDNPPATRGGTAWAAHPSHVTYLPAAGRVTLAWIDRAKGCPPGRVTQRHVMPAIDAALAGRDAGRERAARDRVAALLAVHDPELIGPAWDRLAREANVAGSWRRLADPSRVGQAVKFARRDAMAPAYSDHGDGEASDDVAGRSFACETRRQAFAYMALRALSSLANADGHVAGYLNDAFGESVPEDMVRTLERQAMAQRSPASTLIRRANRARHNAVIVHPSRLNRNIADMTVRERAALAVRDVLESYGFRDPVAREAPAPIRPPWRLYDDRPLSGPVRILRVGRPARQSYSDWAGMDGMRTRPV